jgi:sugar/nucleoside kinase (ribokinase family)
MRLAAIGDCLVDVYPDMGLMYPGGNALNVAVAARRAGIDAGFVGAVGDDAPGRAVLDALEAEGIAHERVRTVAGGPTSHATVAIVDGDRIFTDGDVGVSELDLDEEDDRYLAGFDLIHTGDNSLLERSLERLAALAPLSFDFGSRPHEYCAPLLPHVTVAAFSVGPEVMVEQLLRDAVRTGTQIALATGGAAGAWALVDDRMHHAPPSASSEVLDTLGAGDAFIGTFLAGFLRQLDADTMLRDASLAAASAVSVNGAFGHGQPATPVGSTGRRVP